MGSYRPVSSIAIIGAGPSGLAAAKYLLAEQVFDRIDIFEQRDRIGGVWNLSTSERSKKTPIPQTNPRYGSLKSDLNGIIWDNESLEFESPLYEYLETNIPKQLMAYSDQAFDKDVPLFPGHEAVLKYLERYADEVRYLIKFDTQVSRVSLDNSRLSEQWLVKTQNLGSGKYVTSTYDAIVIANGHYTVPYVPDFPGIRDWNEANPGTIIHSKAYRKPEDFKGKKVLVIGNSASGTDIATQISAYSKHPLLLSSRTHNEVFLPANSESRLDLPEVVEFMSPTNHKRAVKFSDGRIESDLDAVVYATGYFYNFPFLDLPSPLITDGFRTHDVYQHVFHIDYPTLVFSVLNLKVIPFPLAENQAAVIARVWSGRLSLPSRDKMKLWQEARLADRSDGKAFHVLRHPEDVEVLNGLYDWARSADKMESLNNNGIGKLGTFWDEEAVWMRSQFPKIKAAFAKRGEDRVKVTTLEELDFDYKKR